MVALQHAVAASMAPTWDSKMQINLFHALRGGVAAPLKATLLCRSLSLCMHRGNVYAKHCSAAAGRCSNMFCSN